MLPHHIIDTTMERGEADKLARLTGRSDELFNSFRRLPRSPENPQATGNYSPVYHYLQYFEQRKAVNPDGAIRMHRLVNAEIEESLTDAPSAAASLAKLSNGILNRAVEAINKMSEMEVEEAGFEELQALDVLLGRLDSSVGITRAQVRAELRRREGASSRVTEMV